MANQLEIMANQLEIFEIMQISWQCDFVLIVKDLII